MGQEWMSCVLGRPLRCSLGVTGAAVNRVLSTGTRGGREAPPSLRHPSHPLWTAYWHLLTHPLVSTQVGTWSSVPAGEWHRAVFVGGEGGEPSLAVFSVWHFVHWRCRLVLLTAAGKVQWRLPRVTNKTILCFRPADRLREKGFCGEYWRIKILQFVAELYRVCTQKRVTHLSLASEFFKFFATYISPCVKTP